jgi:hypothetical protein
MLASDTPVEVDIAPRLQACVIVSRHLVDAIDRADLDARLTACATVRVNNSQDFGNDFSGLSSKGRCGHHIVSEGLNFLQSRIIIVFPQERVKNIRGKRQRKRWSYGAGGHGSAQLG